MTHQTNSKPDALRRMSIRFEGEVQGVGFRWTSRRLANELRLTGWVRNEWDGSVSMELQGTGDQIATFLGRLPRAWGHFAPRYIVTEQEDIPVRDDEPSFRVRF